MRTSQRQYIGQIYDVDTGLNYLNARYYKSDIGQFISQDSMFWQLPQELLIDPQQQNSYSYARNNPILLKDPNGDFAVLAAAVIGLIAAAYSIHNTAYAPKDIHVNYSRQNGSTLSVPVRDTNINVTTGEIKGDIYSFMKNQGFGFNTENHNLNPDVANGEKSTSLEGIKQNSILGAIELKQNCNCSPIITGGTERGFHALSKEGNGHEDGVKLDYGLERKLNNFIQNNFTPTGNRNYDQAPGYKDNLGNGYWREGNHWDNKHNQNYQYKDYSLIL